MRKVLPFLFFVLCISFIFAEDLKIISNEFCKNVVDAQPVDISDVFTSNDERIYLWINLGPYKESHSMIFEWYSPDGELFASVPYNLPSAREVNLDIIEEYRVWSYLNLDTVEKSMQGIWSVKLYIDNNLKLTRLFRLVSDNEAEKINIVSSIFCENIENNRPVNPSSDFTFDNKRIYLWLALTPFKNSQKVTWKWYSPDDELYFETELITPSAKEEGVEVIEDYTCHSFIYVDAIPKKLSGVWTVEIYINDIKRTTKEFRLLSDEVDFTSSILGKNISDGEIVNPSFEFTFDDEKIYLWLLLTPFKESTKITWNWYSPDNKLFATVDLITPSASEEGLSFWDGFTCWAWLEINKIPRNLSGIWKVDVYINDLKKLTKHFKLSSKALFKNFKEIQIEDIYLEVPEYYTYFEDPENPGSYYILLDETDEFFAFLNVTFTHENLLPEKHFNYIGPWFKAAVRELVYEDNYGMFVKAWDTMIEDYTDSKGRNIYLFFSAPENLFKEYKPIFKRIFDSFQLTVY